MEQLRDTLELKNKQIRILETKLNELEHLEDEYILMEENRALREDVQIFTDNYTKLWNEKEELLLKLKDIKNTNKKLRDQKSKLNIRLMKAQNTNCVIGEQLAEAYKELDKKEAAKKPYTVIEPILKDYGVLSALHIGQPIDPELLKGVDKEFFFLLEELFKDVPLNERVGLFYLPKVGIITF